MGNLPDFPAPRSSKRNRPCHASFAVEGVTGVFFGTDCGEPSPKADGFEWDHLKPALLGAIMEAFPIRQT